MTLAKKAGKATLLLLLRKGWGALLSLFVMAYLARTLEIDDFGIVAISATLINFIQVFGISGISEYVVFYNEKDKDDVVNSAFWLNIVITICILIILVVLAPTWAKFYNNEAIESIVYLLCVSFFFNMLSSIPVALYRKDINYKPMVIIQIAFGTISQLSQVLLAFLGFGVYSLAIPAAVIIPLLSITLFVKSSFRPTLKFSLSHWKKIFTYTKYVIGSRIVGMLVNNGDNLLIAKILSLKALGIYDIAFKLSNLFINHFNPIVTNISLPILSKSNNNFKDLTSKFKKMIEMLSVINFPVIIGMILFAEPLILLLYGDKWISAIIPFQVLSIFVLFRSIGSPASGLYNAVGKPKIGFYFTMIYIIPFFITIYISSFYGLIGFCIGVTSIRVLGSSTHLIISSKILSSDLFALIKTPLLTLLSSCIAFLVIVYFEQHIHIAIQVVLYLATIILLEMYLFKNNFEPVYKNFKNLYF